jgi:hypothetical protein
LKIILQHRIWEMSRHKWGIPDFTWIYYKCNKVPMVGSMAWQNICKSWSRIKKIIIPELPELMDKARSLPVWAPNALRMDSCKAGCKTNMKKLLMSAGIEHIEDILTEEGRILQWEDWNDRTPSRAKRAYSKLIGSYDFSQLDSLFTAAEEECSCYVALFPAGEGSTVWKINISMNKRRHLWGANSISACPSNTYQVAGGLLREIVLTNLPAAPLFRLTTCTRKDNSKGKRLVSVIGLAMFQEGLSDQFKWLDARDLHDASTSQIRKMLTDKETSLHVSIAKWEAETNWRYSEKRILKSIWRSYRAPCKNIFL